MMYIFVGGHPVYMCAMCVCVLLFRRDDIDIAHYVWTYFENGMYMYVYTCVYIIYYSES